MCWALHHSGMQAARAHQARIDAFPGLNSVRRDVGVLDITNLPTAEAQCVKSCIVVSFPCVLL